MLLLKQKVISSCASALEESLETVGDQEVQFEVYSFEDSLYLSLIYEEQRLSFNFVNNGLEIELIDIAHYPVKIVVEDMEQLDNVQYAMDFLPQLFVLYSWHDCMDVLKESNFWEFVKAYRNGLVTMENGFPELIQDN